MMLTLKEASVTISNSPTNTSNNIHYPGYLTNISSNLLA